MHPSNWGDHMELSYNGGNIKIKDAAIENNEKIKKQLAFREVEKYE